MPNGKGFSTPHQNVNFDTKKMNFITRKKQQSFQFVCVLQVTYHSRARPTNQAQEGRKLKAKHAQLYIYL